MTTIVHDSPSSAHQATSCDTDPYGALVRWLQGATRQVTVAPKCIGVTCSTGGAGVSSFAHNLAVTAACASDQSVLLLDLSGRGTATTRPAAAADATRPSQLCSHVVQTATGNLSLLSVADVQDPQSLAADKDGIAELLRALENDFELIIVDLPPVSSNLCFVTAGLLGGVLLVMESERTRRNTAVRAKQRLLEAHATVLGIILNKHRQHLPILLNASL